MSEVVIGLCDREIKACFVNVNAVDFAIYSSELFLVGAVICNEKA